MGVLMRNLIYIAISLFSFAVGRYVGFRDGVEIVEFNREHANEKLQQCLRILRKN